MKNVMVYLNPRRGLDSDSQDLLSIQLENSLELGWAPDDILLITNFPHSQDGVRAVEIPDRWFCQYAPINTKVSAMVGAFEHGIIGDGLHWLHDLDAFQCVPFGEEEIALGDTWDMGVAYFGRLVKWSGGVIFFNQRAGDIFRRTSDLMHRKQYIDEGALTEVSFDDERVHNRIRRLNPTWNFTAFNHGTCWKQADKPLRVVHFHPREGARKLNIGNLLEFFKGGNRLGVQFIPDRLLDIFGRHGIR